MAVKSILSSQVQILSYRFSVREATDNSSNPRMSAQIAVRGSGTASSKHSRDGQRTSTALRRKLWKVPASPVGTIAHSDVATASCCTRQQVRRKTQAFSERCEIDAGSERDMTELTAHARIYTHYDFTCVIPQAVPRAA